MLQRFAGFAIVTAVSVASACGGDITKVGDNGGGTAGVSGGSGAASGAGGSGNQGGSSQLSGTWDLVGSVKTNGTLVTGTLELPGNGFVLVLDGATLTYVAYPQPKVSYQNPWKGQSKTYVVTHSSSYLDLGLLPLAVGGAWSFSDPSGLGSCSAMFNPTKLFASCTSASGEPAGFPSLNATLTAERTWSIDSRFGELGGVWEIKSNNGQDGQCTATIESLALHANCSGTGTPLDGALAFSFVANSDFPGDANQIVTASGSTSQGLEISAVRR